ncbi:unnamed protein product [Parascedosporium putredinis]|uniref:Cytochrome P450 n=1 Tax=Parascedosporium putredinis TaxID=1442378 RepID=A0A9P1HA50_9PEZI|nr:unnamed protein product [Parascedosporium putredinis]CAI8003732.1 unnamed protein product [Parascedosporium putredinis]
MGVLGLFNFAERGVFANATIFLISILCIYGYAAKKIHPKEPAVIASKVPFVGHLIGMAMQGGKYVKNLGLAHKHMPIFTLPVPMSRIYIVTDPSLAAVVQRASKSLSFTPLVPNITERVLGLDKRTVEIVKQNLDPLPGEERGFLADIHDMLYGFLGPGEALNEMSRAATQELYEQVAQCADHLRAKSAQSETVDLLEWVRHFVAAGTARFLYGPNNPFEVDPELEKAFWDFDHGLGGLLMGLFPSLTAAKAYNGREKLAKALKEYLEAGHQKRHLRFEYRNYFVLDRAPNLGSSSTTVQSPRRAARGPKSEFRDHGEQTLSMNAVRDKSPTLMAVFRECLRVGSENYSTRLVKEDTMLADRYFLRKDSVVQIAGSVIHSDQEIWGDDVAEFNPDRFLQASREGKSNVHPAAFRAFGGGKTLCPGRHFATNEIVMLAALMIMSFEFTAPDGGQISVPKKNDAIMPVHVLEPLTREPVRVHVALRERVDTTAGLKVVL